MWYVYYVVAIGKSGSILSLDITSMKKISSIEDVRRIQNIICEKCSEPHVTILNYILLRTEKDN